ncbi:MAG: hypothetical protein QF662_04925 [Phycisphaerae bacterium]|nr:hypothetical protein [Phycisphaerae bacterium]
MSYHVVKLNSVKDQGRILERVESVASDEKTEQWLQDLIFARPELLPVAEFDESISELVPIGREVGTPAGSIDDLFITPEGRLVIVETKLWKNPEKHRTVVAQVIDYAKEVASWDYNDLDEKVLTVSRSRQASATQSLSQLIKPFLEEHGGTLAEFEERVIDNMKHGRFLLLIVGDKISPNLALLSESIHGVPGLEFQLGLIELCLYPVDEGSNWPLIVTANIVGKTVEQARAIVKIQYKQEIPQVAVEVSDTPVAGKVTCESVAKEMPEDLRPVYEQWVKKWQEKGFAFSYGTVGMGLRVFVNGKFRSVGEIYPTDIGLIRRKDLEIWGVPPEKYQAFSNAIGEVPAASGVISSGRKYLKLESLTAEGFGVILNATTAFAEDIADR